MPEPTVPPATPPTVPSVTPGDATRTLVEAPLATGPLPAPPQVRGYEVLDVLGRGGMGVVYRARQLRPDRTVALKMILAGAHAGTSELERFRREAEAAARLSHPNIVQVYEVGEHDGLPFFSLECVEGGSLAARLDGTPWPATASAGLVEVLARAVQAAHEKGIVHRDLTPGNVLLTALPTAGGLPPGGWPSWGTPKITDFGLAKRLDVPSQQTQSGAIIGTPSYMAPEQAAGRTHEVGPLADVYALGAVLYELLTGRPPFKGETQLDTVLQVVSAEVVPPARLQPGVPRDLETICLKCLEKESRKRYSSALELADDLRRFLANEPIHARPAGGWERATKWAKRRPAVAALVVVSVLASAALLAGAWLYSRQLEDALAQTRQARTEAEEQRDEARRAQADLVKAKQAVEGQRDEARKAEGRATEARAAVERQHDETRRALYRAEFNVARRAWDENQVPLARDLLAQWIPRPGDPELRGFEWHYLLRQCQTPLRTLREMAGPVQAVAFSPTADLVAVAAGHTPDGFRRPVAGEVKLFDPNTGKVVTNFTKHSSGVLSVCFSPDGKRIASADAAGTVLVWETGTGKIVASRKLPGEALPDERLKYPVELRMAFTPDGKRLALGGVGHSGRVWDLLANKDAFVLARQAGSVVQGMAVHPSGKRLATAGSDGVVRVHDAEAGKELLTLRGHFEQPETDDPPGRPGGPRPSAVLAVAFSPDGKLLASASADTTVKVWDAENGKEVCTCRGHAGAVLALAFSPDGRQLASGAADHTLRVWNPRTGREARTLKGPLGWVRGVAFSRDGSLLAAADSAARAVQLWDARSDPAVLTIRANDGPVLSVAFSPGGRRVAACGVGGFLKVWHPATGEEVQAYREEINFGGMGGRFPVIGLAYSREGGRLATGYDTGDVRLRDADSGVIERTFRAHEGTLWDLAFSPDGKRLATAGGLPVARVCSACIWDVATGRRLHTLIGRDSRTQVGGVSWRPDGKVLATASHEGVVRLWDTGNGKLIRELVGHEGPVRGVCFSPDGKRLASASYDGTLKLWDPDNGKALVTLRWHTNQVTSVAFSPDSKRLASASEDRTLHVWDAASGQELLALRGHASRIMGVAFSPDGRYLASGDYDGIVKVWDSALLTPAVREEREALAAELRVEREASSLVRSFAERPELKEDVIASVRAARLEEAVRRRALTMAEQYRENSVPFNDASWKVVCKPGAEAAAYQRALRQAERACELAPDNGESLNTLGVAQYRTGKYEEAIKTLLRADRLNRVAFEGSIPGDWAFLAMAYHRLGQTKEADDALRRLRRAVRTPRWERDAEAQMLAREAEALLKSP